MEWGGKDRNVFLGGEWFRIGGIAFVTAVRSIGPLIWWKEKVSDRLVQPVTCTCWPCVPAIHFVDAAVAMVFVMPTNPKRIDHMLGCLKCPPSLHPSNCYISD